MLAGWNGNDRADSSIELADEEIGPVNVEWLRRKGRFSLDVQVYGDGLAVREPQARLCRATARALGRALLFSDCGSNPFSYFLDEPDGSLWHAYIAVHDDLDIADLIELDAGNADALSPRLVASADAAAPLLPPDTTQDSKYGRYEMVEPPPGHVDLCRMFAAPYPKTSRRPA